MTYEDVVKKVKKNPIDFVYTQKDGYRIVTFVYKRIFNLTDDKKELLPSNNGISKELGYDFKHAYLMFNKQNKLELMVSKDEMENGMLLLNFARDIYRVIKNDGDNLIRSDTPDAFFKTPKYNTDSTSTIEKVQPINSGKRK